MNAITKYATTAAPKEVAPRTFRFVASTGERDRDGDVIEPSAWRLEAFQRNPVILMGHDYGAPPVARAVRVSIEGGRLVVDVEFPEEGTSEASDEVLALVRGGYLRAVSVGFRPLEREPLPDGRGYRYTAVELLEVSLVSVPSNASALLAARLGGKSDRPLYVDGAPLTVARLGAILSRWALAPRPAAAEPRRFVVTGEAVAAAVKAAVRDVVRSEIRYARGVLD